MQQYEIRFNNLKYQVFQRSRKSWLFKEFGYVKWTTWRKLKHEFDTEREAVHEIKLLIKYKEENK